MWQRWLYSGFLHDGTECSLKFLFNIKVKCKGKQNVNIRDPPKKILKWIGHESVKKLAAGRVITEICLDIREG
jgi:hypothetical protein